LDGIFFIGLLMRAVSSVSTDFAYLLMFLSSKGLKILLLHGMWHFYFSSNVDGIFFIGFLL